MVVPFTQSMLRNGWVHEGILLRPMLERRSMASRLLSSRIKLGSFFDFKVGSPLIYLIISLIDGVLIHDHANKNWKSIKWVTIHLKGAWIAQSGSFVVRRRWNNQNRCNIENTAFRYKIKTASLTPNKSSTSDLLTKHLKIVFQEVRSGWLIVFSIVLPKHVWNDNTFVQIAIAVAYRSTSWPVSP